MADSAKQPTNGSVDDRTIYLVIRRALLAVIGIFDRKYSVNPSEK